MKTCSCCGTEHLQGTMCPKCYSRETEKDEFPTCAECAATVQVPAFVDGKPYCAACAVTKTVEQLAAKEQEIAEANGLLDIARTGYVDERFKCEAANRTITELRAELNEAKYTISLAGMINVGEGYGQLALMAFHERRKHEINELAELREEAQGWAENARAHLKDFSNEQIAHAETRRQLEEAKNALNIATLENADYEAVNKQFGKELEEAQAACLAYEEFINVVQDAVTTSGDCQHAAERIRRAGKEILPGYYYGNNTKAVGAPFLERLQRAEGELAARDAQVAVLRGALKWTYNAWLAVSSEGLKGRAYETDFFIPYFTSSNNAIREVIDNSAGTAKDAGTAYAYFHKAEPLLPREILDGDIASEKDAKIAAFTAAAERIECARWLKDDQTSEAYWIEHWASLAELRTVASNET